MQQGLQTNGCDDTTHPSFHTNTECKLKITTTTSRTKLNSTSVQITSPDKTKFAQRETSVPFLNCI